MNTLQFYQKEIDFNGQRMRLEYDEDADMLEIFFGANVPATGVELTDNIVLRLEQHTGRAISLTLLHFSILTERTEYGPRSYPLTSLKEVPQTLREMVLSAIQTVPVNQFLKVSYFQASSAKRIPFTYVEPPHFAAAA